MMRNSTDCSFLTARHSGVLETKSIPLLTLLRKSRRSSSGKSVTTASKITGWKPIPRTRQVSPIVLEIGVQRTVDHRQCGWIDSTGRAKLAGVTTGEVRGEQPANFLGPSRPYSKE